MFDSCDLYGKYRQCLQCSFIIDIGKNDKPIIVDSTITSPKYEN